MTKADFQEHLSALAEKFASLYGSSNETYSGAEAAVKKGESLAESLAALLQRALNPPPKHPFGYCPYPLGRALWVRPRFGKYGLFIKNSPMKSSFPSAKKGRLTKTPAAAKGENKKR